VTTGVADALGILRLAAAAAMPAALAAAVEARGPRALPLALFAAAAASDFLDGPLARRSGRPTSHGAALDNVADIAFVLATLVAAAAHRLVSWAVPAAIVLAFGAYVVATAARREARGPLRPARSRLGHAGGVANYALAGLVAGALAVPGAAWPAILALGSAVVVALNGAAVLDRVRQRATLPARATPVGGSRARSARSSA